MKNRWEIIKKLLRDISMDN